MPNPSIYPLIAALGLGFVPVGLMLRGHLGTAGTVGAMLAAVAVMAYGIYSWAFEPLEG